MNTHKNARLTFARRLELAMDVLERELTLCAAAAHNVSVPTARKWVGRYLAEGESGLARALLAPQAQPPIDRPVQSVGDRGTAPAAPHPRAESRRLS